MNFLKACLVTVATAVVFPVFGSELSNAPSYANVAPDNEIAYRSNRVYVNRGGYYGPRAYSYGYRYSRPYYYNSYYRTPYYRNYYYRTYDSPYYYRDRDSGIYFRIGL